MKDGGPAFGGYERRSFNGSSDEYDVPVMGMSLRDYFAAAALPLLGQIRGLAIFEQAEGGARFISPELIASEVYRLADALIAERERAMFPSRAPKVPL